jgi:hypothetical protein
MIDQVLILLKSVVNFYIHITRKLSPFWPWFKVAIYAAPSFVPLIVINQPLYNRTKSSNSYYGPGVVIAWLALSAWILATGECRTLLLEFVFKIRAYLPGTLQRKLLAERQATNVVDVDGPLVSLYFYAVVGLFDAYRVIFWPTYDENNDLLIPDLGYPAFAVCRLVCAISSLAIWGHMHSTVPSTQRSVTQISYFRPHSWNYLSSGTSFVIIIQTLLPISFVNPSYYPFFVLVVGLMISNFLFLLGKEDTFALLNKVFFPILYSLFILLALVLRLRFNRDSSSHDPWALTVAWPQTKVRMVDMDQWTALSAAFLGIAGMWLKR